jgi:hypothetical protein
MEILIEMLVHGAVMIVLAVALGWVIEKITGERRRKELMGQYWSLKSEMDNIERINRQLEDAAGSGKKKQGD